MLLPYILSPSVCVCVLEWFSFLARRLLLTVSILYVGPSIMHFRESELDFELLESRREKMMLCCRHRHHHRRHHRRLSSSFVYSDRPRTFSLSFSQRLKKRKENQRNRDVWPFRSSVLHQTEHFGTNNNYINQLMYFEYSAFPSPHPFAIVMLNLYWACIASQRLALRHHRSE